MPLDRRRRVSLTHLGERMALQQRVTAAVQIAAMFIDGARSPQKAIPSRRPCVIRPEVIPRDYASHSFRIKRRCLDDRFGFCCSFGMLNRIRLVHSQRFRRKCCLDSCPRSRRRDRPYADRGRGVFTPTYRSGCLFPRRPARLQASL